MSAPAVVKPLPWCPGTLSPCSHMGRCLGLLAPASAARQPANAPLWLHGSGAGLLLPLPAGGVWRLGLS